MVPTELRLLTDTREDEELILGSSSTKRTVGQRRNKRLRRIMKVEMGERPNKSDILEGDDEFAKGEVLAWTTCWQSRL